jgi:hypothetical protein
MGDYDLSGVWMDGEHLIIDDAHLQTLEGLETPNWSVVIDGAHILRQEVNRRVILRMATAEGTEVEGEARVVAPGRHDEGSKVYDDVRLEGLTSLHAVR